MTTIYRFKRKTINVACYDGKIPIPALVLSEFEIHGTLNADGIPSTNGFTVTHTYTGYSIAKLRKQTSCRKLVEAIVDLGLNWQYENPDQIPDEVWTQAKPVIQKWISNPAA